MAIEFIPAVCPKCGGELRVPKNLEVIKCMYCGQDVLIHNPNKIDVTVEYKRDVSKLLQLARISESSKNYVESSKYYSQILENDLDNRVCWLGKARAVAMQSSPSSNYLDEAVSYCKIALTQENKIDEDVLITLNAIAESAQNHFDMLVEFYTTEYQRKQAPNIPDAIAQIGKSIHEETLRKETQEKFIKSSKQPLRAITFCWQTIPTKIIGQTIYNSYAIINKAHWLLMDYANILSNLAKQVAENHPELEKPKSKKCFIATATLDDINHPYVCVLREYRDSVLSNSRVGRKIIKLYYFLSPPCAKLISKHQILKAISLRWIVLPAYNKAVSALINADYLSEYKPISLPRQK